MCDPLLPRYLENRPPGSHTPILGRLTAIPASDAVGYAGHMGEDEADCCCLGVLLCFILEQAVPMGA